MRDQIAPVLASLAMLFSSSSALADDAPEKQSRKESSDSGPQWLWLQAEAGGMHVALNTFDVDPAGAGVGFHPRSADGPMIGVGGGLQLFVLTLGPRARLGLTDQFRLATVGGELGVRVPIYIIEPHFEIGGGYASIGDLEPSAGSARRVSIDGPYGRFGGGIDLHPTRLLTLGTDVSGEIYGLSPEGVSVSTAREIQQSVRRGDSAEAEKQIRRAEGASYGSSVTISGSVGLHY